MVKEVIHGVLIVLILGVDVNGSSSQISAFLAYDVPADDFEVVEEASVGGIT
eukprot:CAMPEP_0170549722 /NCGR_PEP_ID=MMETSP0211-20121228/7873_1 /TAXON_ID=311385 /ORGANISM="Pseudokeronopsis sp., Strain OXSARD2" /LENGTH=51 /DNA_ID=CAMNT_0010855911 /DNA_START=735 /DNA_END=890 /DNA_ORIENTATION=+